MSLSGFTRFRRKLKGQLPYVRRRIYKKNYDRLQVVETELDSVTAASSASIKTMKKSCQLTEPEVCYFVTYANVNTLKDHVVNHVERLIDEGVSVVLIVNFDGELSSFSVEEELLNKLSAVYIRENLGFDFAAWSHCFGLAPPSASVRRAFFINDSIVGPLNSDHYSKVLNWVRKSDKPVLGLTSNPIPEPHFQSYYWVLSSAVLQSPGFIKYFSGFVNYSDKQFVIDHYEVALGRRLQLLGFEFECMFENTASLDGGTNQTVLEWEDLLERGFPFIKKSVVDDASQAHRVNTYICQ